MSTSAEPHDVSHITAVELLRQIDAGRPPVILDVRTRSEYRRGHVPGALQVPFWRASAGLAAIPAKAEDPIVVYCELGPRARFAGAALRLRGFRRVSYLKGHMSGWRKAGLRQEGKEE